MYCPRTRGGEPRRKRLLRRRFNIVPARAGVNRISGSLADAFQYCPRTRGGEPSNVDALNKQEELSPHARG